MLATPRKRHADGTPASTPRSSQRIRDAQTRVKQETVEERGHAPATTTSSRGAKKTTAKATVPVNGHAAIVATVVKAEPETPASSSSSSRKRKKGGDARSSAVTAEVTAVVTDPNATAQIQTAAAKQAQGRRTAATVVQTKADANDDGDGDDNGAPAAAAKPTKKAKAPRTSKGQPKSGDMTHPLAARTAGHALRIGAHVSAAGGVQNSVGNAVHIGANAFALFLKSQRKWANPPLQAAQAAAFIDGCAQQEYHAGQHVVPHGSYLVNLAQAEPEKATQALDSFIDDLQRCERLGITLYNFHPGSTGGAPRAEALARIAAALNKAHAATSSVITLLENMAGAGNVIGGSFEDLGAIIAGVHDKSRVGVCLDTCHAFAYGHDLRTPATLGATLDQLAHACGGSPNILKALHVNDSKAPLASHRDLHANIGTGFLGLRAFHALCNEPRLRGLPMVLETPIDRRSEVDGKISEDRSVWAREIKLLESLVGMDVDSPEFHALEADLHAQGTAERERIEGQVKRKKDKDAKTKGRATKKKAKQDEVSSDESEASE